MSLNAANCMFSTDIFRYLEIPRTHEPNFRVRFAEATSVLNIRQRAKLGKTEHIYSKFNYIFKRVGICGLMLMIQRIIRI